MFDAGLTSGEWPGPSLRLPQRRVGGGGMRGLTRRSVIQSYWCVCWRGRRTQEHMCAPAGFRVGCTWEDWRRSRRGAFCEKRSRLCVLVVIKSRWCCKKFLGQTLCGDERRTRALLNLPHMHSLRFRVSEKHISLQNDTNRPQIWVMRSGI